MNKKSQRKQFVAAVGAPFSNEDAAEFGPVLERIAKSMRVNGIASINKRKLYEIVEADPEHPLRRFVFNSDDDAAARAYRIERCGLLLRSIRYGNAKEMNKMVRAAQDKKVFHYADARVVEEGSGKTRGSAVLRDDLLSHDPEYISAVSRKIRQIRDAVASLDDLATARKPPRGVATLVRELRVALGAYESEIQDVAAQ